MNNTSTKMVNVAVTGASGDVGHGTIHGLLEASLPIRLIALDYTAEYAAQTVCDHSVQMPGVRSPDYIDTLIGVLGDESIQLMFCGIDSEVPLLANNIERIESATDCRVLVADKSLVDTWSDKSKTAEWLSDKGLNPPRTWSASELSTASDIAALLPLIAKPRRGHSSQGIEKIESEVRLREVLAADMESNALCLQEYLSGDEYTCGLTFDRDGKLADWIVARRQLVGGRTVVAEIEHIPEIDTLLQAFGSAVSTIGAINIQLRLDELGHPRIFEINPRMSGSTLMRVHAGYNDPARILENMVLGTPIERSKPKPIRTLRQWASTFQLTDTTPPSLRGKTTIVFDCGGTLLHLRPTAEALCQRTLREMSICMPFERIQEAYRTVDFCLKRMSSEEKSVEDRIAFYEQFNSLLASALGIGSRSAEFHDSLYARCSSGILHWGPLPNVAECLAKLSQTYRLFVLANWDSGLQKLLDRNGLSGFFEKVYDSETLGVEKPDVRIFQRFADASGVDPSSAFYVGNEYEADIAGSRAAGFTPILLDNTRRYSWGVDCTYSNDWLQLTQLLSKPSSPTEQGSQQ